MEHLLPWLSLKRVPGIGDLMGKRLIERYHTPDRIFQADRASLMEIPGMTPKIATALLSHRVSDDLKSELELAFKRSCRILTLADSDYPALLREIPDPPLILYCRGMLDGSAPCIAVVGSRNATAYGLSATRRLCADLAAAGICVVSGMARGIDTAAHEGALSGDGRTVAVLGSGLAHIYPPENRNLFETIAENGAVVSEFPMREEPLPHNFPRRNRVIAGMCLGTVIIEAAHKSGSLITARLAADQGREVFAVPGSIVSRKSAGTHALIKQGAKLVENAGDILEEFGHLPEFQRHPVENPAKPSDFPNRPALSPEETRVLSILEPYPKHIDDLTRTLSMDPGKLAGLLLKLELAGWIQQLPGKQFIRCNGS